MPHLPSRYSREFPRPKFTFLTEVECLAIKIHFVFFPTCMVVNIIPLFISPFWMHVIMSLVLVVIPGKVGWCCDSRICSSFLTLIARCPFVYSLTHSLWPYVFELVFKHFTALFVCKNVFSRFSIANSPLHCLVRTAIFTRQTYRRIHAEGTCFHHFFLGDTKYLSIVNWVLNFWVFVQVYTTMALVYVFDCFGLDCLAWYNNIVERHRSVFNCLFMTFIIFQY